MEQYGQLLSLAVIAIAFYMLMIRPQQKRQKEHQALWRRSWSAIAS